MFYCRSWDIPNSQHRPEDLWFVIGAPSNGILTEKICWSLMVVDRDVRTVLGSAELRADSASLAVVSRLVRLMHLRMED